MRNMCYLLLFMRCVCCCVCVCGLGPILACETAFRLELRVTRLFGLVDPALGFVGLLPVDPPPDAWDGIARLSAGGSADLSRVSSL